MVDQSFPFQLRCSCGAGATVRVPKNQLVKDASFVSDCPSCKKTLVLNIVDYDERSATLKYEIQVRLGKQ